MSMDDTLEYFRNKAEEYDLVDEQVYWVLSDSLLWAAFQETALSKLGKGFSFLDAGGGTGRWSSRILGNYEDSIGTIYDLSPDMLKEAQKKQQKFNGRLKLIQGNIESLALPENNYDLTFNFHNVLGFVDAPKKALQEMVRVTQPGGYLVSFVPNLHHNVFFNLFLDRVEEAEQPLERQMGRFTTDMPYMHMFTPASLTSLYTDNGLSDVHVYGFPSHIYPGMQETQLRGSTENLKNILSDKDKFNRIYDIEKAFMYDETISARGNNLFVIGKKVI